MEIVLFALGILYANTFEYAVHRYLFHEFGKKKDSLFSFHLREHHLTARHNDFFDSKISKVEMIGIPFILLAHLPIAFFSPFFYSALVAYGVLFILIHNFVHRYPAVAKKVFWWHWNHHMRNQNKSWGVVLPIMDLLSGTLQKRVDQ